MTGDEPIVLRAVLIANKILECQEPLNFLNSNAHYLRFEIQIGRFGTYTLKSALELLYSEKSVDLRQI